MVAVILPGKALHHFLIPALHLVRQHADGGIKHPQQFFPRDAAQRFITGIHTDVPWLVEPAEHTHLGKLCHARQQNELQVLVGQLEHTVEALEQVAVVVLQGLHLARHHRRRDAHAHHVEQRLVIFVYQHHGPAPRLLVGTLQHTGKTVTYIPGRGVLSIDCLPAFHRTFYPVLQTVSRGKVGTVEIHMKHRILQPVLLQPFHGQSPEQFPASQKIVLQRGDEQALAEAARTAQKVDFAFLHQPVYQVGLVHIHIAFVPYLLKRLHSYGVLYLHFSFLSLVRRCKNTNCSANRQIFPVLIHAPANELGKFISYFACALDIGVSGVPLRQAAA